ncbi:MAG: TMEM14 family protein [Chlamydiia bacterium]|nr:TMEM14 family protein [Chlamydiia bacterium]
MERIYKQLGLLTLLFSLLVFSGGVMGFAMKGSMPSLVMGSLFGLSLLLTSVKTFLFLRWGLYGSALLILALDGFFSYRFATTKALFPAGMMVALTTLVLLFFMMGLSRLKKLSGQKTR